MSSEAARNYMGSSEPRCLRRSSEDPLVETSATELQKDNENEEKESSVVVLMEIENNLDTSYVPEYISRHTDSEISQYIIGETRRIKDRIHSLRTVKKVKAHGRRSKMKEIREDRKQNEKIIRKEQLEEKLSALRGEIIIPIRINLEGDKINSFELKDFESKEKKYWWTFLHAKGQLQKVAELFKACPQGFELLEESFLLRYTMAYGYPEDMDKARERLRSEEFGQKLKEVPTDYDPFFVPLFRMVSEYFER